MISECFGEKCVWRNSTKSHTGLENQLVIMFMQSSRYKGCEMRFHRAGFHIKPAWRITARCLELWWVLGPEITRDP